MIDLRVIADDSWPSAIADEWARRLERDPALRMCLPTGSTPVPVYEDMSERGGFADTTIFLLDEFGLPSGDPGRCDAMLERDLLSRLPERPAQVEMLDPQAKDLEAECRRFDEAIADGGLGLSLLGLGRNGHLGVNEPGSDVDSPTRVVDLAQETIEGLRRYGADTTTTWGMTVGLGPLLASSEIWLLVSGERKATILDRSLNGPVSPSVPASLLRTCDRVTVWADESAASHLR